MGNIKFKRSINAAAAGLSYLIGRISGYSIIAPMPVAAGIEISSHCNLRCPECASGSGTMTRERGYMNTELFGKILGELGPYLYNANLYFQGEPMLHPRFFDFLEMSRGQRVTVSTNGHFMTPENAVKLALSGLNRLIISLDGLDNETYSLYRKGGESDKVINGIINVSRAIRDTGSPLKLEVQCLVNKYNEGQIPSLVKFSGDVNAVLRLKSMQVIEPEDIDHWQPEKEKYRRYKNKTIKNSLKNNCLRLWMNPVITWNGEVVPCCFDKNAEHVMGDLMENSFRTIWHGEKYETFRKLLLNDRKSIEICRNCTSGLKGVIYEYFKKFRNLKKIKPLII
jgi:radical SAM protein with 4Fe4S-binding SPASM domain